MNFSILSSRLARTRRDLANNSDKNQKFEKDMRKKKIVSKSPFQGLEPLPQILNKLGRNKKLNPSSRNAKGKAWYLCKIVGTAYFQTRKWPLCYRLIPDTTTVVLEGIKRQTFKRTQNRHIKVNRHVSVLFLYFFFIFGKKSHARLLIYHRKKWASPSVPLGGASPLSTAGASDGPGAWLITSSLKEQWSKRFLRFSREGGPDIKS